MALWSVFSPLGYWCHSQTFPTHDASKMPVSTERKFNYEEPYFISFTSELPCGLDTAAIPSSHPLTIHAGNPLHMLELLGESALGLEPGKGRWMNEGLFKCLGLWSALMHRRLPFVCGTRPSKSLSTLFHSETLPAGQICQSKGAGTYKYHRRGVRPEHRMPSYSCSLLALTPRIQTHRDPFGIRLLCDLWISIQPWFCPCAAMSTSH